MDKVLYVAMSGAREAMLAQQAHANNLANATTTGFKADLAQARAMPVYGAGQPSRVYAQSERPATDTLTGTLTQTGRDLDIAIDGDGWLAVVAPDGSEGYTRAGELQINAANQLVTGSGLPVLGAGDIPVIIPPSEKVDIGVDGTISARPLGEDAAELLLVDRLKLVNPEPGTLFKGPDGLMRADGNPIQPAALDVRIRPGHLETSNVNSVSELTDIIGLARQFEMQVKLMKTAEENSEAAARVLQLS